MRKLLFSLGTGALLFFIPMVVSLLITPYILDTLSREQFGIYQWVNSLIIWIGVFRAGQNGGFRYQLSLSFHRKQKVNELFSTLIAYYSLSSIIFFVVGMIGYEWIASTFNLFTKESSVVKTMTSLLLLNFCLSGVSFLFSTVLSVYNREYRINLLKTLLLVLQALLTFVFLKQNLGTVALALPVLISGILFFIGSYALLRTLPDGPVFHFQSIRWPRFLQSLSVGKWFFIGFISQLFIRHTDVILIGKFAGLNEVTLFLMNSKLYMLGIGFFMLVIKIITPHLLKTFRHNHGLYWTKVIMYLKIMLMLIITASVLIFWGTPVFLKAWLGEDYFLGMRIDFFIMFSFVVVSCNEVFRSILLSHIPLKRIKFLTFFEGGINLLSSLVLGSYMGLNGVVLGTCCSALLACMISMSQIYRVFQTTMVQVELKKILYSFFLYSGFLFLLSMSYLYFFKEKEWPSLLIFTCAVTVVFFIGVRKESYYAYTFLFKNRHHS